MVDDGDIDTVLVCFTDLQGRLIGKRVTGSLLLRGGARRRWRDRGVRLPARGRRRHDPAPGLRVRELGDGLRRLPLRPRLRHAARDPVAREDRARAVRPGRRHTGEPVEVSPRRILQRQLERAADARLHGEDAAPSSSSSCSASRTRRPRRSTSPSLTPALVGDRGLPHLPDDARRVPHPPDPQRARRRGDPRRVLEGRGRQGSARDQPPLRRRARRWPTGT